MTQPAQSVAPRQDDPPYRPGEPAAPFIPCYIDQFYPQIAQATAELLKRYGVPLVYPPEQTCCGQPAFNSGYWEEARRVMANFCDVFQPHRWIVCPSASCTAMCRVFFGHADPDPRIVGIGRRVFELTEFLHYILGVTDTGATFPHKVTMHIGCHGRRELGTAEQPMRLLRSVRGLTYCELPNIEECCGFGGTFSVKMPGTSLAMGGTKVENIVRTGAEVVVSNDISCLMHIGGILQRKPETRHIRTMHVAEVLVAGWREKSKDEVGNMNTEQTYMTGAEFLTRETKGLSEPHAPKSLGETAERSAKHNREVTDAIPYFQDWRNSAHEVKSHAVSNLDKLLVEFERKITARGATVLWAKDAAEANQQVLDIARKHGVKSVVKSKSMVSEELELNQVLESAGIRAIETDLGEYIVQLAQQRPVHIVTPAIHMSAADVGRLFAEKLGEPFSEEHSKLTDIARRHLREEYLQAGMGISGCNFAVADTGTMVVVENEGNAGLSTATPPVHVALIGIEKMLPRIDDLPLVLNLLARSGTGQKLTTYTHLFHGVTPGKRLYVILLDNGRSNVLKDPLAWSSLHCIRCGACMNNCPVYRRVGGWAYGWVYPGPIGSILTPHLIGLKKAGKLPFASSLCGACGEVCPVKIDIAHQLVHLRHRAVNEPSPMRSWTERLIWVVFAWFMAGPLRYKLLMTGVRIGVRLAKFLPWHPDKLGAWTRGRELPRVPGPDFRSWWRRNREKYEP